MMTDNKGINQYLIDNTIIFNPSDLSLSQKETLLVKILKPVESRYLLLLIEKQGAVVSQNEVMAYAWGGKHREVSYHMLYHCILTLVKHLFIWGYHRR